MTTKFRYILLQPIPTEQSGDFRSQPDYRRILFLQCVAKDVAHFFFHT